MLRSACCALLVITLAGPARADTAYFGFSLPPDNHPNPTLVSNGLTVVCETDSSTLPLGATPNPFGVAQMVGGYSLDDPEGPISGGLRLSDVHPGGSLTGLAAAWLEFSTDVYQIEFYAWDLTPEPNRLRVEAYDPDGGLVATVGPAAVATLPTPAYEHLVIRGDTPIRKLRLVGRVNNAMIDAMTVWTESATAVRSGTWGELKERYR